MQAPPLVKYNFLHFILVLTSSFNFSKSSTLSPQPIIIFLSSKVSYLLTTKFTSSCIACFLPLTLLSMNIFASSTVNIGFIFNKFPIVAVVSDALPLLCKYSRVSGTKNKLTDSLNSSKCLILLLLYLYYFQLVHMLSLQIEHYLRIMLKYQRYVYHLQYHF